jgi:hypothetical protein
MRLQTMSKVCQWHDATHCGALSLQGQSGQDHAVKNQANGFTKDYAFSSPSAAAAIVAGRSANGRTSWVLQSTGQTYADWEESLVQATEGEPA